MNKTKKVLILGPLFYNYSKSVAKAFTKAGYEIDILEWVENGIENIHEKIGFNLSRDKNAFFEKKELRFNKKVINKYNQFKPDIVFVIRGSVINRESLSLMKQSILILWMMDSIFLVEKTFKNIDLYNHLFVFEKEDIPKLKNQCSINAYFLPLALDEDVYFPIKNTDKPIDILFVGALYHDRVALLNRIIGRFRDKNIKIYGVYFSKLRNLKRFIFRKDKKYFVNQTLKPQQLNIKYSQAKICINIHHSQSIYGVNQRFFELSGAKALQICDKRGFIEDNFTSEQTLLYNSENELFKLLENALLNYESFEDLKESIYSEVLNKHTFYRRIKQVIKHCQLEI